MRFVLPCLLLLLAACSQPETYDIVLKGGRVMDPASGLDAVRDVGINGDQIAKISEEPLGGKVVLDASGDVVAPGFIDLHEHGQSPENYRAQIEDGVTTALELEIGVEDIAKFYDERAGGEPVNYGASISHPYSRNLAMTGENPGLTGDAALQPVTPEQQEKLLALLEKGLEQGAAAVGFGIAYTPGMTQEELEAAFAVAAKHNATAHVHMRTNRDSFANLEEVVTAAGKTGASLHVVHINSSGDNRALGYLERIQAAQDRGIDVTTECYPYNRGSTFLESHQYDDWEKFSDEYINGFTWVKTGEQLTRATFGPYREEGGLIISPPIYSLETVRALVAHPIPMIASDGMWIVDGRAHPRTYGTYSRVLGRYVREEKALTLMDALAKMTVRPAQRLEKRVPMMAKKGRVQEGMDADITVFNPETVIERATYENPAQPSAGIDFVLVNGVVTLRDGAFVEGAKGGEAVRAPL
ncbi:MAG: amidohydrolase family protein [Bryobacterales bacterium]|nr:amidohydrolase family protein [Bryobacterales bacterium]